MDRPLFAPKRKSNIERGDIYFWTATINKWQRLLEGDGYKDVIVDSLQYLTDEGKIDVFAFIIMPNHIHLIWRINEPNGKESPHGSFLKYTAHKFKQMLKNEGNERLALYKVNAENKNFEFWQRDSLAIPLFTRKVALQKLNYLHNNPLQERWNLVKDPCHYKYSSARYYELNEKNFPFLKDLWDEL
jgi:putative transposase